MNLLSLTLAALLGSGALAGCHAPAVATLVPGTTRYSVEDSGKFARLDARTQAAIRCTGLQERVQPDGRMEVVANVRNLQADAMAVNVRCVFKDARGFALGAATAWQTLRLAGESTETVCFAAHAAGGVSYTILVQAAP